MMNPAGNDVCLRQMMCALRHIAAKQHIIFAAGEYIIKNTPCAIYGNGTGGVCIRDLMLVRGA